MTIEDLKGLMDAFDPASLLPDLGSVVGKLEFLMRIAVIAGPVVLLVMGLLYLIASPREANYYLGYRCYYGMGSVGAWRFSQRLAGVIFTLLGLVLTVVMVLIAGSFPEQSIVDTTWRAVRCLLWQAGLTAAACLAVNITVAAFYDRKGERRRK